MSLDVPEVDEVDVIIDPEMFNEVYLSLLENTSATVILFGGSSSGKSSFFAQQVVIDIVNGGRNYLICRATANTIFTSIRNEIVKAIKSFGLEDEFTIPKSDFTITCSNGHQILFAGLDDVEKLKSITPAKGVITDIGIEEATEIIRDDLKQLEKRLRGGAENVTKRITLLFNPILQNHWIYEEYFKTIGWKDDQTEYKSAELYILKTTYKDNKFLTAQDISKLENERDKYYYDVYTLGNWGVLGNIIFSNWKVADLNDPADPYYLPVNQRTIHRHGGDFGFGGNPAAISAAHYDANRKRIYVWGELYKTGLTNDVLALRTKELIPTYNDEGEVVGTQPITWDSAEPKSIAELKNHGVNALHAKKGPDSILFGIQWLQQQEIIIDKTCTHHRTEFSSLKWKEDRKTGKVLQEPVGADHLIDARRYGSEQDMIPRGKARSYEA